MIFYKNFGVSVIYKQPENDHFKVKCVIFEVIGGNLQNLGVKQLKQTKFGHFSTPKLDTLAHVYSAENSSTPK